MSDSYENLYKMKVFDLYLFLKHENRTNFTNSLFRLIFKADAVNLARIAAGFPTEVRVVQDWRAAPT